MATSDKVLETLDVLRNYSACDIRSLFEFVDRQNICLLDLCEIYKDVIESSEDWPARNPEPEDQAMDKLERHLISEAVRAQETPSRMLSEDFVEELKKIVGDDKLDEYFTRRELQQIPGVVLRWKKLRALHFVGLPEERVTEYLRQATTCYLYGLPSATVALCRAVLEFALQEAGSALGGKRPESLKDLINDAARNRLIPPRLIETARRIQRQGNQAIHQGACSEEQALAVMRDTREILKHLYKTPRRSSNL